MRQTPLALAILGIALLAGAASALATPARTRGVIVSVSPSAIVVNSRSGEAVTFTLNGDTKFAGEHPVALSAIQPGSYIGSAAVPTKGGVLRALEITVFPPSMKGVGEGHYAWDLTPHSSMTNGTVGNVLHSKGDMLTVTYNGGQEKILVPPGTPIVTVGPGSAKALQPGVKVIVFSDTQNPNLAAHILYGERGITPPQ